MQGGKGKRGREAEERRESRGRGGEQKGVMMMMMCNDLMCT